MSRINVVMMRILEDVAVLVRFMANPVMQRGLWDNVPPMVRKRLIDGGLVIVQRYRVFLSLDGLSVIEHTEEATV